MASSRASWKRRLLHKVAPFLFKKCPEGNWHYRWHQICWCRLGEHCGDWHGGVYSFLTDEELHRGMYLQQRENIMYQRGFTDGKNNIKKKVENSILRSPQHKPM